MKRIHFLLSLVCLCWLISACQRNYFVCPPITGSPLPTIDQQELILREVTPISNASPIPVEINGKLVPMDRIVEGPLCNDSWSGKVYVGCDVQVAEWVEDPLFLKNCHLPFQSNLPGRSKLSGERFSRPVVLWMCPFNSMLFKIFFENSYFPYFIIFGLDISLLKIGRIAEIGNNQPIIEKSKHLSLTWFGWNLSSFFL